MALYRNIHISFWSDPNVIDDYTPEDRYFYLYLLTNPHTNLCGCYEISLKQMSDELGYTKEVVERLIDRFQNIHRVLTYNKPTKELFLHNWAKYNWTLSPKFRSGLEKEIPSVKCSEFREIIERLAAGDTVQIPYPYPMDTTVTVSDTDTATDEDTDTDLGGSGGKKPKKAKKGKKAEPAPEKKRHGLLENVLLTDVELAKLQERFPSDWSDRIDDLSTYMASKKKSYADHYATILSWARRDEKQKSTNQQQPRGPIQRATQADKMAALRNLHDSYEAGEPF